MPPNPLPIPPIIILLLFIGDLDLKVWIINPSAPLSSELIEASLLNALFAPPNGERSALEFDCYFLKVVIIL